jgi:hypothetical protein
VLRGCARARPLEAGLDEGVSSADDSHCAPFESAHRVGHENSMQCLTCGCGLPVRGRVLRIGSGLSRGTVLSTDQEFIAFLALHQLRVGQARTMTSGIAES